MVPPTGECVWCRCGAGSPSSVKSEGPKGEEETKSKSSVKSEEESKSESNVKSEPSVKSEPVTTSSKKATSSSKEELLKILEKYDRGEELTDHVFYVSKLKCPGQPGYYNAKVVITGVEKSIGLTMLELHAIFDDGEEKKLHVEKKTLIKKVVEPSHVD